MIEYAATGTATIDLTDADARAMAQLSVETNAPSAPLARVVLRLLAQVEKLERQLAARKPSPAPVAITLEQQRRVTLQDFVGRERANYSLECDAIVRLLAGRESQGDRAVLAVFAATKDAQYPISCRALTEMLEVKP